MFSQGDISTRGEIERLGRKVFMYTADLCSQESVTALVFDILAKGHIVHVLLNCSDTQRQHPAHLFPDDDWEEVLKTSLTTAFTVCREVGTHMLERNPDASGHRGSIINIVSRVADKNGLSTLANSASNGGVSQLTKALSNEWAAEGIRVNAIALDRTTLEIHPSLTGDMDTREDDLRRERQAAYGTPEGLEGSVVYLASRASGYVTGTTMTVKGK
jgi:2-deoxy-D-gluconate 3-dehydrogenase